MASLKTIIVPVDGSDLSNRAIPVAAAIATAAGASMAIVSVARYEGALAGTTKRVREARHLVPEGIPVEVDVVVSPSPVVALLERAAASASVLCLATHDRRPVSATLLDSVGSQIIEHARRPLIIVGPAGDGSRLGRDVVVALDGVHDAASLLRGPCSESMSGVPECRGVQVGCVQLTSWGRVSPGALYAPYE